MKSKSVGLLNEDKGEKSWPQIVAVLSACLSMLIHGTMYAWPSPFLLKITKDKENYNINEQEASYFAQLNMIAMLASPLVVNVINIIGRKSAILYMVIPQTISILIPAFATNLWLLYLSRIFDGLADAVIFCAIPAYIGEVASPSIRGVWGNAYACFTFVGYVFINVLGTYFSVKETSYIVLVLPTIILLTFTFMPETPYYYVMKNKDEDAKKSLRQLKRKENVDEEFNTIKCILKRQLAERGSWKDLFMITTNRKALIAGVFLRFSQQLTGIFTFNAYNQYLFEKSGNNIDAQSSSMIYTSACVIMFIISSYFSDKLGRRRTYMISLFLASIIVFSEGIYFFISDRHTEINLDSWNWFPLGGMLTFVVVAVCGLVTVPTIMMGELFSTSIKSKGMSVLVVTYAAATFLSNTIFYYLNAAFGLYAPFFLYGFCNLVSIVITYYLVPETQGKSLDDIQLAFKNM